MRKFLFMAAVSAAALSGGNVMAADVPATGHINARIVEPLSVTEDEQLNFGAILQGENLVTITPGNMRSATQTEKLVGTGYGSSKAGKFTITGPSGAKPTVTIADTSVELAGPTGSKMTVDNFVTNAETEVGTISGSAGTTGKVSFNVGADLHVADAQTPGDYTGSYTVQVHY